MDWPHSIFPLRSVPGVNNDRRDFCSIEAVDPTGNHHHLDDHPYPSGTHTTAWKLHIRAVNFRSAFIIRRYLVTPWLDANIASSSLCNQCQVWRLSEKVGGWGTMEESQSYLHFPQLLLVALNSSLYANIPSISHFYRLCVVCVQAPQRHDFHRNHLTPQPRLFPLIHLLTKCPRRPKRGWLQGDFR